MKQELKIHDKTFVLYIPEKDIKNEVIRLSKEISNDFNSDNLVFLIVLNGAFV